MSFSADTKAELCKLQMQKLCCARAEAYGILLYCNTFNSTEIKIVTESKSFVQRLSKLFHKAFSLDFDRYPAQMENQSKYVAEITDKIKLEKVMSVFGIEPEQNFSLHINYGMLEESCCRIAFLRGAFLAGGSVTDPNKRYHLELSTSHFKVSRELEALMLDMGLNPKSTVRKSNYVTYFKQSEYIEDLLTRMGAPVAAMEIMSAKVEKDLRNEMNRRVNCDSANIGKAVEASMEQVNIIHRLENDGTLETLPEKLKETAMMRLKYPEMSLTQLAECFSPPLTKSCINHRIRKLMDLAK